MPVTSYTDPGVGWTAWALQARTNSAGSAVDDAGGEDARLAHEGFTAGIFSANAFQVLQNSPTGMSVLVGSGTAKADVAQIQGTDAGQGFYRVRLGTGTTTVTVPAAHATNPRIDQVFLVVQDNAYDSSARVLPRIGYRQGDAAGSPSAPGPDASWDAHLLIATIAVAASTTSIVNANITDNRSLASLSPAIMGAWEVDNVAEVGFVNLTASMVDRASVVLTIPPNWGSWKCVAWASFQHASTPGAADASALIRIDGVDGTISSLQSTPSKKGATVAMRRTGLTSIGSRTISLRAAEIDPDVNLNQIFLYARAVRTS